MTPTAREMGVLSCHGCGLVCQEPARTHGDSDCYSAVTCPRCSTHLCRHSPNRLARSSAFLIAGMILYVPANLLPVMYTSRFGTGSESTIMSGIIEFCHAGAWDIALIIFIASVAVPCTKFVAMGLLLVTAHRRSRWAMRERTRLYQLVEFVGYWSMLDVLVVAIVAALVQFKSLSFAEPRSGILFFGMVVILTMLSAMNFDPRLIWGSMENNDATS